MTAEEIKNTTLSALVEMDGFDCACGRRHSTAIKHVIIEDGAVRRLPALLRECGSKRPFILSGAASFAAAGQLVEEQLASAGIGFSEYVFPQPPVSPAEWAVGSAAMHFNARCDSILAVGSGVINDIAKLLSSLTGLPFSIVATAPSMDGYASATSSMERDGLKISLPSTGAWAVIGDLDILAQAPLSLLQAGVGDMLAKTISLCEWKLANRITGEYYCPTLAAMVEGALEKVVAAAPGLLSRDHEAVKALMEGMVISGLAMQYAGLSRPASGMEHYFSHIWDMRALAFPEAQARPHGIQCGIATLYSLRVYEWLRNIKPNREKALEHAASFSYEAWSRDLLQFIGPGARAMIDEEKQDPKYALSAHALRLEQILRQWDELTAIMDSLPSCERILVLMKSIGAPVSAEEFGYTPADLRRTFTMTKDIRNKYIGSLLLWDLGLLDRAADSIF